MRIQQDIKKFIEFELRRYDSIKTEWENIQSEIVRDKHSSHDYYMERIGKEQPERCNGQTESKALKLLSNARLAQLERTMKAIEKVSMSLPEEKYKLLKLKYWTFPQYLNDEGIANELSIDRSTVYDWSNTIILAIGKEMGVIN